MSTFDQYSYVVKLILIGDSGVGKTSLLQRFLHGRYNPDTASTIGVEFGSAIENFEINGHGDTIKMQIWDTGGSEKFRAIATSYYRGTAGVVLVFDLQDRGTFLNAQQEWYAGFVRECVNGEAVKIVLVGTKFDLSNLCPFEDEVLKFANKINAKFIKTSSSNNYQCADPFLTLTRMIYSSIIEESILGNRVAGVNYCEKRFYKGVGAGECILHSSPNYSNRIVFDDNRVALIADRKVRERPGGRCRC